MIQLKKIGRFYKLDASLVKQIDSYSNNKGMRKEAIIELALKRFFKNTKK